MADEVVALDDVDMIAVEGDLGEADPAALRHVGRVAHGAPLLGVEVVGDQLHGVLGVVLPLPLDGAPRSEEHTSELQSLMRISYAVFCLKKKTYTVGIPSIANHSSTDIL